MNRESTTQIQGGRLDNGDRNTKHKKGGPMATRSGSVVTKAGESSIGNRGRRGEMSQTLKHKQPIHRLETRQRHQRTPGTSDTGRYEGNQSSNAERARNRWKHSRLPQGNLKNEGNVDQTNTKHSSGLSETRRRKGEGHIRKNGTRKCQSEQQNSNARTRQACRRVTVV
jgi:hypothetical protein